MDCFRKGYSMQKNKVLTTIFACIPGAGQMYLGHMKLGSSTMFLFAVIYFLGKTLNMSILMSMLPVIWFFSFFDTLNKNSNPNVEPDHYIFSTEAKGMNSPVLRLIVAFLLIFCGGTALLQFVVQTFAHLFPWQVSNILYNISNNAPKILVGIFVLYIGCTLIVNKKDNRNY